MSARAMDLRSYCCLGWALAVYFALGSVGRADERADRALEGQLLHRRPPLSDLQSYARATAQWQKLRVAAPEVLVVNLWARTCPPCLAELPIFRDLVTAWQRKDKKAVQFLFIADPPDQTSPAEVVRFWSSPFVDTLAGPRCPGVPMQHGAQPSCLLSVPDVDPARSEGDALSRAVLSDVRPLTLILDQAGVVRQVFVGSLASRASELSDGIERLLSIQRLQRSGVGRRTPR